MEIKGIDLKEADGISDPLEKSIKIWELIKEFLKNCTRAQFIEISDPENNVFSSKEYPLCKEYLAKDCEGCVVNKATHGERCFSTPWEEILYRITPEIRQEKSLLLTDAERDHLVGFCEKQIKFLKSCKDKKFW